MRQLQSIGDCSCLICSGFAENDEVVAMEDFIDVGNILGKSWVSLCTVQNTLSEALGGQSHCKMYRRHRQIKMQFSYLQFETIPVCTT